MLPKRSTCLSAVALTGSVVLLLALAGCAGGAVPPSAGGFEHQNRSLASRAAAPRMDASGCGKAVVYVTSYDNSVYIYNQKNGTMPCGRITGLTNPQGLFVDAGRNLWVAIAGDCHNQFSSVFEFAPGGTTPVATLQDPDGPATGVAVDKRSGTVYVTNFFGYSQGCISGNNGTVEVYAAGSTVPTAVLSDPNMNYAFNDAVDDRGNLYVTYLELNGPSGSGRIDEWLGGGGSAIDLGIALQAPGGIQTTKSGALLVCDQLTGCGDFLPGSTQMSRRFATAQQGSFGVALDRHEKHAWVENAAYGLLQRYNYPGPDDRSQKSITVPDGGYAGVAVSPPSPPGAPY